MPDHKSAWVQAEHYAGCGFSPSAAVPNLAAAYLEAVTLLGQIMITPESSEKWAEILAKTRAILTTVGQP